MTQNLQQQAKSLIESHDEMIEETSQWLEAQESDIDRSIRELIIRERQLTYTINYLEDRGECPDILRDGLSKVREKNKEFRGEYSGKFHELAVQELLDLVDRYPTVVCYAFELDPMDIEVDHDFATRDSIEMLLSELPDDRIPAETETRVGAIDDVLRCRCKANEETYREIQDMVSRAHYPPRFWWRHPEQVLDED